MKKYIMITPESQKKIVNSFTNAEEITIFISQMEGLNDELLFCTQMRNRLSEIDACYILLKQICILTLFCQENMDLIHQLVQNLDYKEMSQEELDEMNEEE